MGQTTFKSLFLPPTTEALTLKSTALLSVTWATLQMSPWFEDRLQIGEERVLFCSRRTFRVPMVEPYMWYQNWRHLPLVDLNGGLTSQALCPFERGEEVSMYK